MPQKDKKKADAKSLITAVLFAAFIYLFIQGLALWMSHGGAGVEKGMIQRMDEGEIETVTEDPEDPYSAAYLFAMVVFVTVIMLVLIKYSKQNLIKVFIYLGFFTGLYFTFQNFIGWTFGFLLAVGGMGAYLRKRNDPRATNILLLLVLPGIGSLLGGSLSLLPAFLFILALSIYDVIAVFGTKHMQTLAKAGGEKEKGMPLMFLIPVGERTIGLGTGDLALPVVFTVSLLRNHSLGFAATSAFGGLVGLVLLLTYVLRKRGMMLPALPPITLGLFTGALAAGLI